MSQVDPVLDPELMEESMNQFDVQGMCVGSFRLCTSTILEKHGYALLIGVTPTLDLFWVRRDLLSCYDVPDFKYFQVQCGWDPNDQCTLPSETFPS
jgi:hypothetical protein